MVTLNTSFGLLCWSAALEVDDPSAHTDADGVGAITRVQFPHDMFDVNFDGLFGDKEFFGDIPVSISIGNRPEHVYFTLSQEFITHMFRELGGYFRRDSLFSCVNLADHIQQIRWRHAL